MILKGSGCLGGSVGSASDLIFGSGDDLRVMGSGPTSGYPLSTYSFTEQTLRSYHVPGTLLGPPTVSKTAKAHTLMGFTKKIIKMIENSKIASKFKYLLEALGTFLNSIAIDVVI